MEGGALNSCERQLQPYPDAIQPLKQGQGSWQGCSSRCQPWRRVSTVCSTRFSVLDKLPSFRIRELLILRIKRMVLLAPSDRRDSWRFYYLAWFLSHQPVLTCMRAYIWVYLNI
ncbi:hypothetical protein TNCT_313871 [Trichonephila clavata]|uniref:Uncharacterized protein n=1 Tax=Trichonephila clavata TaxID=2740835 RepID=A0A8X6LHZ7_TRICU|nr:hypothetical protein TNCT_313871 [Trichonephila clavata]